MASRRAILLAVVLMVVAVNARPDSAGIVPLTPGWAYGGIPYGSVTGMVAQYEEKYGKINGNFEQVGNPLYAGRKHLAGNNL